MKIAIKLFSIFSLFISLSISANDIISTVDKNPIVADESVNLTVIARGNVDRDAIDFSVLEADFRVSAPSVSQSTQIINGNRSSSVTWRVSLFPLRQGTLTIPSFTLGSQSTQPIDIEVLPPEAVAGQPREFYLTTKVDSSNVYLQQQVTYTVKIYLAGQIQSGSLSEPVLDGAIIEKLGEDKEYEETINGIRYRVIERQFAIIPQSSGEFSIQSPLFEARVLANNRQSFAYFNRAKNINRIGPEQVINVNPIPDNYAHAWLPSERVELYEEWGEDLNRFTVGEPITRTLTLSAIGVMAEQLPDIQAVYHPSFNIYPEQPQTASVQHNGKLVAQSVQAIAIIPQKEGDFVLPEISVPWFNVKTQQVEFATLPAQTVRVLPDLNAPAQPINPVEDSQTATDTTAQLNSGTLSNNEFSGTRESAELFDLLHLILITTNLITAGVLGYIIVFTRRRSIRQSTQVSSQKEMSEPMTHLKIVLAEKEFGRLPQAFIRWAQSEFKRDFNSSNEVLDYLENDRVTSLYKQIQSFRYSKDTQKEQVQIQKHCEQFISELERIGQQQKGKNESKFSLYPA